jgi:hypothetical protein
VPLLEQEMLTLTDHSRSPQDLSGIRVARSSISCLVFWWPLFFFLLSFSFDHCTVWPSSDYCFWLPLWFLVVFLIKSSIPLFNYIFGWYIMSSSHFICKTYVNNLVNCFCFVFDFVCLVVLDHVGIVCLISFGSCRHRMFN